jgi:transcription initiation factor IIE alpha subunit
METIMRDTGIKKSSLQQAIKILRERKLIAVYKHRNAYGYSNNEYYLLSLDNPEIYRDLDSEADELPMFIGEDLPA